jgi:hypothetical protein
MSGATLLVVLLPRLKGHMSRGIMLRLLALLLVLRFVVPLMALTGEGLYSAFLAERFDTSSHNVQQVTERIGELNRANESAAQPPADESLMGSAKRLYQAAAASLDVSSYIDRYQQAAADVSEQVINLIVVFVVQTVLLPLLFLWGLLQVGRRLLFSPPGR